MTLFIIDDHLLTCSGFKQEFDSKIEDITVVGYATNIEKAIDEIKKLDVQIIVLDLFIKFLDPVKNVRLLRKSFPQIPIVILSYEQEIDWQLIMFKEGIRAFLSKSDEVLEMKNAFQQVAKGKTIIPEQVLKLLNFSKSPEIPVMLPSEKQIIQELLAGQTIKEIADGRNRTVSAIDKEFKKIRNKFSVKTNYQLLTVFFKCFKL